VRLKIRAAGLFPGMLVRKTHADLRGRVRRSWAAGAGRAAATRDPGRAGECEDSCPIDRVPIAGAGVRACLVLRPGSSAAASAAHRRFGRDTLAPAGSTRTEWLPEDLGGWALTAPEAVVCHRDETRSKTVADRLPRGFQGSAWATGARIRTKSVTEKRRMARRVLPTTGTESPTQGRHAGADRVPGRSGTRVSIFFSPCLETV
jgi:hypothetical protein